MDIRFKLKMIIKCVDKINLKIREYMYINSLKKEVSVVYDVKGVLDSNVVDAKL